MVRQRRELESEQQALDESKAATKELEKKTRTSNLHPLLARPSKQTVCHLDLDLETPNLVKPVYSDRTEELRAAAASHLAGIEAKSTDKLKYLEGVVSFKDRLQAVLMEAKKNS